MKDEKKKYEAEYAKCLTKIENLESELKGAEENANNSNEEELKGEIES